MEEVTGEWRKLHGLNNLQSSPNTVWVTTARRMRWSVHVPRIGLRRGVYMVLVKKPKGKRPLGRPRIRWEDNIKIGLQEVGCEGMDRLERPVSIKSGKFLD
jgi:hypothetical protein